MPRTIVFLALLLLAATSALAGGFQVAAQGARAMGMGLAYTAVADDASAIFYNPAGLMLRPTSTTWGSSNSDLLIGGMLATNLEGTFDSTGTPPGPGISEEQRDTLTGVPQAYWAHRFGSFAVGVGAYTPFGLPMRWEEPNTFTGRFISQTALLRTINLNPTVAWAITPNLSVGAGADYLFSKVQLERNQRGTPGTPLAPFEVVHVKLRSDLPDSSGWGWNAGVMWRAGRLRVGAAYRSSIEVEHEGVAEFTQISTGNAQIDAIVRANLPASPQAAAVTIEYPSSLNVGLAYALSSRTTLAVDAHRTNWSSFQALDVFIEPVTSPSIHRQTDWEDAWAWRIGAETACGAFTCRAGYYRDETPQPLEDVGPVLPDADRHGFALGLGIPLGTHWSVDLANIYIKFDERTTDASNHDQFLGTYNTTANEFAVNLHWH